MFSEVQHMELHPARHMVTAGRQRTARSGQSAGSDYDLLACLADAAAAAPLGAPVGQGSISQKPVLDRTASGQIGPPSDAQQLSRRHLSSGRVSPPPPAMDAEVAGNVGHHVEREVQVTCNGTLGTFLLPSQTVQCHCARCSAASTSSGGPAAAQQQQQQPPPTITPTEFERHSGLLTAKKWRNSIRLLQGDGTITIGKWLEQHNILPRPKCSGGGPLLGSPGAALQYGSATTADVMAGSYHHHAHHGSGMPSSGNDSHHTHVYLGAGRDSHHQGFAPGQRSTLPPSRYPASEYVTGEDEEYDMAMADGSRGTQQQQQRRHMDAGAGLLAGMDGQEPHERSDGDVGAAAEEAEGDDTGYGGEDREYEDGSGEQYDAAEGGRGSRVGRRAAATAQRQGSRVGTGTGPRQEQQRRGLGRVAGGQGGGRPGLTGRPRGRPQGPQGIGAGGGPMGRRGAAGGGGGGGMDVVRRGARGGGGGGGSSQEEGGGGGRRGAQGREHSSSEGSPPSDDSKRRDGSGGSGEGDGSGTGDGGDSRRQLAHGGGGGGADHRMIKTEPDLPGGGGYARRPSRHHPSGASAGGRAGPSGGREGSAEPGAAQDRSARHAAAVKRLPPEYLTGEEIGPAIKRSRTRGGGGGGDAASGGGGSRGGSGGGPAGASAEELAAMYDMAAAGPQIRGWRFLGPSAGPAADQVLISVTINGRTFTGLLAPQQPVPPPAPIMGRPPLPATAASHHYMAAGAAMYGSGGATAGGGGGGRRTGPGRGAAVAAARVLPPLGPSSRRAVQQQQQLQQLGHGGGVVGLLEGAGEPEIGASGLSLALAAAAADATADAAATPPPAYEDEPYDDGMPLDCPRCALCHRCGVPTLALPPPPPPLPLQASAVTAAADKPAAASLTAAAPAADPGSAGPAAAVAAADATPASTASVPTNPVPLVKMEPEVSGGDGVATPLGPLEAASQPPPPSPSPPAAPDASVPEQSQHTQQPQPSDAGVAMEVNTEQQQKVEGDEEVGLAPGAAAPDGADAAVVAVFDGAATPVNMDVDDGMGKKADGGAPVGGDAAVEAEQIVPEAAAEQVAEAAAEVGIPAAVVVVDTTAADAEQQAPAGAAAAQVKDEVAVKAEGEESAGPLLLPVAVSGAAAEAEAAAGAELAVAASSDADVAATFAAEPAAAAADPEAAAAAVVVVAAEASRTARQTGCGLGPLVEVRGACGPEAGPAAAVLVHSQCALWSPEVFVIGGSMYGVPAVIKRCRARRCTHCGRSGATLACCSAKCGRVYHLPCAMEAGAMLVAEPFSMACPDHRNAAALHPSAASQPQSRPPASRLRPAGSLDATATQSTAGTTNSGGAAAAAAAGSGYQQQPQVALPMSLQMAAGRRVVQPSARAASGELPSSLAAAATSRPSGDASGLPALMMLRSQPDAAAAAAKSMPPPRASVPSRMNGAAAVAGHMSRGEDGEMLTNSGDDEEAKAAAAGEGGAADVGAAEGITEPGQAATGGGAAMRAANALAGLYGNGGGAAGMSSGLAEMSVGSEGTAMPNGVGTLKRRREQQDAAEAEAAAAGVMPAVFLGRSGEDMEMDAAANGGMHFPHPAALAMLQQQYAQQQQQGIMGPEGMHAMLLASGAGCGEGSVGSPFGSGGGRTGGGGRQRYGSQSQRQGASASAASASTGLAGMPNLHAVNGGGGGSGDPDSPTMLMHHFSQAAMLHVLPRAARNIEGLLPARPLLHNPYVPSSGDPSADLTLSKIATSGCREAEAELLGGTTGRAGHSGRCAVCVIQRKGKCGTESAPKKCLRRQLVALQRATNVAGGSASGDEADEHPPQQLPQHLQQPQVYVGDEPTPQMPYMEERAIAAAAEMRARERARRETWSLPLGQGSGATSRRPPQVLGSPQ